MEKLLLEDDIPKVKFCISTSKDLFAKMRKEDKKNTIIILGELENYEEINEQIVCEWIMK